jgi:hypothetical protein
LDAGGLAAPPHAASVTAAAISALSTRLMSAFSRCGMTQRDHVRALAA